MDTAKSINSHRLLSALISLAVFALPLDLLVAQLSHALLSRPLGGAYILVHPLPALCALVLAGICLRFRIALPPVTLYGFSAVMLVSYVLSGYFGGSDWIYTLRAIGLGIVPLLLLYVVVNADKDDGRYGKAFGAGLLAWGVVTNVLYLLFLVSMLNKYVFLREMPLDQMILALRSPGTVEAGLNAFFTVGGNVNKIANIAVLSILVAFGLWTRHDRGLAWFIAFALVMDALVVVTLSRGAILVALACAVLALVAARLQPRSEARKYILLAALLALPAVLCLSGETTRGYFLDMSSLETRVGQWSDIVRETAAPQNQELLPALLGYGPGRYGDVTFGTSDARTHNLFIDIWADGGLPAAIAFVILLALPLGYGLRDLKRKWDDQIFVGVLGIIAIVGLGLREYELAYLNTTSIGSVLLGWFIALAVLRAPPTSRRSNMVGTAAIG